MAVDIDPKTGAPIVTPTGPIVSIPPAVTSAPKLEVVGAADVPLPVVKEETKIVKTRKEECLDEMNAIIAKHGGNLGDIPINDHYWDLLKEYRIL